MSKCSGDVGYCEEAKHPIGITLTWDDDDNVVEIDCNHKTCGYMHSCKLYQRRPIGYHQIYPNKK